MKADDNKVLVKEIYTIHEEDEEVEINDIQPNIEESDQPIPTEKKKHIYLIQILSKLLYQMICANQFEKNLHH